MAYFFDKDSVSSRVFVMYGNINDFYMTLTRGWYGIDALLESHLKMLGYQVVLFYEGGTSLRCYDRDHAENRLKYYPTRAEAAKNRAEELVIRNTGADNITRGRRPKPLHPIDGGDAASRAERPDGAPLKFDYPVDNLPTYLDGIMRNHSVRSAIVFKNASRLFAEERFSTELSNWCGLSINNSNIAILLFNERTLDSLPHQLEVSSHWRFLRDHVFSENGIGNARIHIDLPKQDEIFYLLNAEVAEFRSAEALEALNTHPSSIIAAATQLIIRTDGKLHSLRKFLLAPRSESPIKALLSEYGNACEKNAMEHIRNTEGWKPVYDKLDEIINLAKHGQIQKKEQAFELNWQTNLRLCSGSHQSHYDINLSMSLQGPPGTGKTTAAEWIGRALRQNGILPTGQFIKVTRAELVAGYVGQTALKTREWLEKARGGVLFVDEAYSLYKGDDGNTHGDFGMEAIETLLEAMTSMKGEISIILAGYPHEMRQLLKSNSGLSRRVEANTILFEDYQPWLLEKILLEHIAERNAQNAANGNSISFFIDGSLVRPSSSEIEEPEVEPRELARRCRAARLTEQELCPLSVYIDNLYEDRDRRQFGNAGTSIGLADQLMGAALRRQKSQTRIVITKADFPTEEYFEQRNPTIQGIQERMRDIVGMEGVKTEIERQIDSVRMARIRNKTNRNRTTVGPYLIVGNPGTGKTMIAETLSQILCNLGVIQRYDPVRVTGNDLISRVQRQGGTDNIKEFIREHNGCAVVIDEAHQLAEYNLGRAVIQALLDPMLDADAQICFIFNCYPNRKRDLLNLEEGFERRIDTSFILPDYSPEELRRIFEIMMKRGKLYAGEDVLKLVEEKMENLWQYRNRGYWQNGSTAIKFLKEALESQSVRLHDMAEDDSGMSLLTLTSEDIEQGYENLLHELRTIHE